MCSQTRFGNPLLAALLILASGSALAATAQAGATLDSEASRNAGIEGRQVDLCAPISSANVWGPPGYGEDPARDSRRTIYLIPADSVQAALPTALGTRLRSLAGRDVQVRVESRLAPHAGKRMRLQGKLTLATVPGDARPVVLDIDRITACTSQR